MTTAVFMIASSSQISFKCNVFRYFKSAFSPPTEASLFLKSISLHQSCFCVLFLLMSEYNFPIHLAVSLKLSSIVVYLFDHNVFCAICKEYISDMTYLFFISFHECCFPLKQAFSNLCVYLYLSKLQETYN